MVDIRPQRLLEDVDVVGEHDRAAPQLRRQQLDDGDVDVLPAVQQDEVDRRLDADQRPQRVALADFHELGKSGRCQVSPRRLDLVGLQLRADDKAAAVVSNRCSQADCGKPEGGTELDDPPRIDGARRVVDELPRLIADLEMSVFELRFHRFEPGLPLQDGHEPRGDCPQDHVFVEARSAVQLCKDARDTRVAQSARQRQCLSAHRAPSLRGAMHAPASVDTAQSQEYQMVGLATLYCQAGRSVA